jgi:hypothetical protein
VTLLSPTTTITTPPVDEASHHATDNADGHGYYHQPMATTMCMAITTMQAMTMAILVTTMDYHLSPTTTITMPLSTKPGTRPTTTTHDNTSMLVPWPVATTMDYHLSPIITTPLSMKT